MSNLIPFNYNSKEVRVIKDDDGNPWFVGKDVAEILGYVNQSDAIKRHCKGVVKHYPLQTAGGLQNLRIVNEPDLYRLIINSELEPAKKFEAWIFDEVLPSIRKTGSYTTTKHPPTPDLLPIDRQYRAAIRMAKATGLDKNQAALKASAFIKKTFGQSPLNLLEIELESPSQARLLTPSDIGVQLSNGSKISARKVNEILAKIGLQESHRDAKNRIYWQPTEKGKEFAVLLDTAKKHSDGAPIQQIKWQAEVIPLVNGQVAA